MKKQRIIGAISALALLVAPLASSLPVSAWGPERPTYKMQSPSDHPTFNSITDNNVLGDERDFVRIVDIETGGDYSSDIELEAGKDYGVYIGYHNNASETLNDKAHDRKGVAWNVRLASNFPQELAAGERGEIVARITADNTDPAAVWDEAYVTAKEAMTLHYVNGSAKIYNSWAANGSVLSTNLFSDTGTFLGMDNLNGMIYGCSAYSGHVLYTIRTVAVDAPVPEDPVEPDPGPPEPEEPEPEPTPDPEEFDKNEPVVDKTVVVATPTELPKTGPVEMIVAFVVILVVVLGFAYAIKSNRAYKQATQSKSKKSSKNAKKK